MSKRIPATRKFAGRLFYLCAVFSTRSAAESHATKIRGVPDNRTRDAKRFARVVRYRSQWAVFQEGNRR